MDALAQTHSNIVIEPLNPLDAIASTQLASCQALFIKIRQTEF
ncbi:hypothetical protein QUB80_33280 [Chlorogloeopsis sp. ULAP01]|nr:hypothetical protein [Chlorogloeopsis sp. ULAP01]MDM9385530.1 hypothetical protein [Chlorogloeopsis sp. ULAP01]